MTKRAFAWNVATPRILLDDLDFALPPDDRELLKSPSEKKAIIYQIHAIHREEPPARSTVQREGITTNTFMNHE